MSGDTIVKAQEMPAQNGLAHKKENDQDADELSEKMANTLTVVDNRTGKQYTVPIDQGVIQAQAFKPLELMVYDSAFMNTACCTSKITFIDGDNGICRYRGYNIVDLAENSSFLEVAFLLIFGELPTQLELDTWTGKVMTHTYLHENLLELMKSFRYDAHPMGMLISTMAAMSTFHPEANPCLQGPHIYNTKSMRNKQIYRILGKLPTVAANAYRHRIGRPYNYPSSEPLSYTENFLYMLDRLSESHYMPDPRIAKALDVLFILHADHELNCSTAAMRHLSSTLVDPFTAVAGAAGALFGPLHGGANESVLRMLEAIGSAENVPQYIEDVKAKRKLLFGFGHRIYKNYDPRAAILKKYTDEVFSIVGRNPLIDVAKELERVALEDEYFIQRKLYPNVDFYSGLIYKALGFPMDMFPVLFCIPRAAGWLAHWVESLESGEGKIWRPRQLYDGSDERQYVPLEERDDSDKCMQAYSSQYYIRRKIDAKGRELDAKTPRVLSTATKEA